MDAAVTNNGEALLFPAGLVKISYNDCDSYIGCRLHGQL